MRTRAIRPGFWRDGVMGELRPIDRLTYIGLWCLADDAGYFETNIDGIGAELFRYEGARSRGRHVQDSIDRLVELKRVELLPCNEHGVIPSLPEHRFASGEQLFTIRKQHETHCDSVGLHSSNANGPDGLHSPTDKGSSRSPRADSIGLHSSTLSDSDSESSSKKTSPLRAHARLANGDAKPGAFSPEKDREEAIARVRSKLDDPTTSADMKRAAQFALERLGAG